MTDFTLKEAQRVLSQKFLLENQVSAVSYINDDEKIIVYTETRHQAMKVPGSLLGFPVETRVTGRIKALSLPPAKMGMTLAGYQGGKAERWRPAPGGVSIGHYTITAGTLAMVVYDVLTGQPLLLSNYHVLVGMNGGQVGDQILQPGKYDGGSVENDTIAELYRFVPIEPPPAENLVDAAAARPLDPEWVTPEILDLGFISSVAPPELGRELEKSGRTTCHAYAEITDVNPTVKVDMGKIEPYIFADQIFTTHLGDPGDSGCATRYTGTETGVGLLNAGSDSVTCLNKLINVLPLLGVNVRPGILPPVFGVDITPLLGAFAPIIGVGTVIVLNEVGVF